jgi:bifunctional NMN adenylyltransferase/nudix hydrolase
MKKFNTLVFIGRFQPFHNGHESVIDTALQKADRLVVLIGSANVPRSTRNPFTWQERATQILANYSYEDQKRIHITPLNDIPYSDEAWTEQVQYAVNSVILTHGLPKEGIGLIGYAKDHSSYYLNMFPDWGSVNAAAWVSDEMVVSATDIRERLFDEYGRQTMFDDFVHQHCSPETLDVIERWMAENATVANTIYEEFKFIKRYKDAWKTAPYPPVFVTTDAVVVQSGHVLLIKRKTEPGKGLWALPGGFIGQSERLEDGMIRELIEETKIKVPADVLRGRIQAREVFDSPNRSARGRTITHAYFIKLKNGPLPRVRGSDDADKAKWVPFAEVKSENMYDDHYGIYRKMAGVK